MNAPDLKTRLPEIVRATLERLRMIEPGFVVAIGVSGGPDSVALLHVLHLLSKDMDFQIVAAHLDHCLRQESSVDAAFVEELARKLSVRFFRERVNVANRAAGLGISVEEAGRRERYAFFERVCSASGASCIATAHHRDDALETFFLRILRGSSHQGLKGIPAQRGRIVRPLIDASRTDILDFLHEMNLPYRIDRTNLDVDTDRNFVRNRLFPVIEERFPNFRPPLTRTMESIELEDAFLAQEAANLCAQSVSVADEGLGIDLNVLLGRPRALQARAVLLALYELSGPHVRWARSHVQAVLRLAGSEKPSGVLHLPGRITVIRQYGRLLLSPDRAQPGLPAITITLLGPGRVDIEAAEMALAFRLLPASTDLDTRMQGADKVFFDADLVPFPLMLRTFRPGDRFRPWGMAGTRKVKKVLIDAKIPLKMRRVLPLLVKDGEILWIPRVRRSASAAVGPDTTQVLEAEVLAYQRPRLSAELP